MHLHPVSKEEFPKYWDAICKIGDRKLCEDDGIVNGVWYTLPSNPNTFGICGACFVWIMKPLELEYLRAPNFDLPTGMTWLCDLDGRQSRIDSYLSRSLEVFYKRDATALDEYVSLYTSVPLCSKTNSEPNRRWYG